MSGGFNISAGNSSIDNEHTNFRILGITIGIIAVILGTVGNALTIIAFFKNRRLRHNVFNLFIVNLSVVDFLTASSMLPFNIAGYIKAEWVFGNDHITCILQAFFYFSCGYTSVVCLVAITVNRFIGIVFPDRYHSHFTKRRAVLTIFLCWIIAPVFLLPFTITSILSNIHQDDGALTGWNSKQYLCTFIRVPGKWSFYMQMNRVLFQLLPIFIMITAYTIMYNKVHNSNQRMVRNQNPTPSYSKYRQRMDSRKSNRHSPTYDCDDDEINRRRREEQSFAAVEDSIIEEEEFMKDVPLSPALKRSSLKSKWIQSTTSKPASPSTPQIKRSTQLKRLFASEANGENGKEAPRRYRSISEKQRRSKESRLLYISVLICLAFTLLFLPSLIINLLPNRGKLDPRIHMAASNITWLNSCVNPIIYVALHRRMRSEYKKILKHFIGSLERCFGSKPPQTLPPQFGNNNRQQHRIIRVNGNAYRL